MNLFSMQYEVGTWTGPPLFVYASVLLHARRRPSVHADCARAHRLFYAYACTHAVYAGATDNTCMASARLPPSDFGKWVHIAGMSRHHALKDTHSNTCKDM